MAWKITHDPRSSTRPPPARRPRPHGQPVPGGHRRRAGRAGWRVVRSEFASMARMRETGRRQVRLGWIPSGDHSFKPTRRSGLSEAEDWATAVAWGDRFLLHCFRCSNSTAT